MCLLHFGGITTTNRKSLCYPRGESSIYDARFLVAKGSEHEKSAGRREYSGAIITASGCGFGGKENTRLHLTLLRGLWVLFQNFLHALVSTLTDSGTNLTIIPHAWAKTWLWGIMCFNPSSCGLATWSRSKNWAPRIRLAKNSSYGLRGEFGINQDASSKEIGWDDFERSWTWVGDKSRGAACDDIVRECLDSNLECLAKNLNSILNSQLPKFELMSRWTPTIWPWRWWPPFCNEISVNIQVPPRSYRELCLRIRVHG